MIDRIFNKYTFTLLALIITHILTVTFNSVFAYLDFIIVIFILTMGMADERNFLWLALLFGFFYRFLQRRILRSGGGYPVYRFLSRQVQNRCHYGYDQSSL